MMAITRSSLALLLAVAAVSSGASEARGNLRHTTRNLQTYSQSDDYYTQMLTRVNEERAAQGLSALCANSKLQSAAKRHSDDMAANNYMAHDGADGSTMSQRITDAGYDWTAVAENVAAGQENVDSVMTSWMNSEGHRANILGDYTMFGTSYAYNADSTYKHYWTQDFGSGDTEACDGGSSTSSNTSDQGQNGDDVAGEASQQTETETPATETPSTTAPSTEAPATEAPATDAPATEAPATETPVVTTTAPVTQAPTTSSPASGGCKAKK
ncbi:hypothetical protein BBJ28_00021829 [Nothophytophthora sp. Chile5]|nr:hypothetical protein BBJ28_00021829 [Nothophytophthora sp. Chile5]